MISQLYPGYAGQAPAEVSYALHQLIRHWVNSEEVRVVRPYLVPAISGEDRSLSPLLFTLEGVQVLTWPVIKIPGTRLLFFKGILRQLRRMGFYPQVVVAHLGYSLCLGRSMARHFKIPLISAVHWGDLLYSGKMLGKARLRQIYQHSVGIACRSQAVYHRFVDRYPQLKERCFAAPSGIEADLVEGSAFALQKLSSWTRGHGEKVGIISVCSLVKLKNIDVNLRVLARLPKDIDWSYTVVGDGPERQDLETLAKDLGNAEQVRFLGQLPRQAAVEEMKKAHIFVMVSAPETFGLVFLEALAKGCLVIGARGFGIDGVIEHGKNGFLCSPRDEEQLYRTLERILLGLDRKDLERVVKNAQATLTHYTEERAAQNYLDHIYKSCNGKMGGISRETSV